MRVGITDDEWAFFRRHLSIKPPPKHTGRPRASDRELFEGIMYIAVTGSQWSELPEQYPAKSSCHRRFQEWVNDGSFKRLRDAVVKRLQAIGKLKLDEGFMDGAFIKAKKGARKRAIAASDQVREQVGSSYYAKVTGGRWQRKSSQGISTRSH